jgi:heptosyltransferase-2
MHTFGVGDMIMFTPALEKLMEYYPAARFDFLLGYRPVADILRSTPAAGSIHYLAGKSGIVSQISELRKQRYDYILVTSGHSGWKSGLFTKLLNGGCTLGDYAGRVCLFDKGIRRENHTHRVVNNLRIIKQIIPGVASETPISPRFKFARRNVLEHDPIANETKAKQTLIGIHCGSRTTQLHKRWPTEHYLHLISKIKRAYGDAIFLLFAGANEDQEAQLLHGQLADCTRLILDKPLTVVAELMRRCRLMIANDSGLGHLAAAVGTPTLSIFGPSDPQTYAPVGEHCRYVKLENFCSPCHAFTVPAKCREIAQCMAALKPDAVFPLAAEMLALPMNTGTVAH